MSDVLQLSRGTVHSIDISVVIPTRNERENIEPLISRLAATLPVGRSQVIFVDDSSDDTAAVIADWPRRRRSPFGAPSRAR